MLEIFLTQNIRDLWFISCIRQYFMYVQRYSCSPQQRTTVCVCVCVCMCVCVCVCVCVCQAGWLIIVMIAGG